MNLCCRHYICILFCKIKELKKGIVIAWILLISIIAKGQEKVVWYNVRNGLPHDVTYEILQTKDGLLYLGTENGITQYDGVVFRDISVTDKYSPVITLLEDGDNIWVGSWGDGAYQINPEHASTPQCIDENFKVRYLAKFGSDILASTYYSLLRQKNCNTTSQEFYLTIDENGAFTLAEDSKVDIHSIVKYSINISSVDGAVYLHYEPYQSHFANHGVNGIWMIDDEFHLVPPPKKLDFLKETEVSMIQKFGNDLYFGSKDRLYNLDETGQVHENDLELDGSYLSKIAFISPKVLLLMSTSSEGQKTLYKYADGVLTNLTSTYHLGVVSDFLLDREGTLWVSTYGKGLAKIRLQGNPSETIHLPVDNDEQIQSGTIDPNFIYALTSKSLFRVDHHNVQKEQNYFGGKCKKIDVIGDNKYCYCVNAVDNTLDYYSRKYIAEVGMFTLTNDTLFLEDRPLSLTKYKNILVPTIERNFNYSKAFWVSNQEFLILYDLLQDSVLATFDLKKDFCSTRITKILSDSDLTLIGTEKCLMVLKDGKLSQINFGDHHYFQVFELVKYINWYFMATHQGIYQFDLKGQYKFFNKDSGLEENYIRDIMVSNDDLIVMGSSTIQRWSISDVADPTPPFFNFKIEDDRVSTSLISLSQPNGIALEYRLGQDSQWHAVINNEILFDGLDYGVHQLQFKYRKKSQDWYYSDIIPITRTFQWNKSIVLPFIAYSTILGLLTFLFWRRIRKVQRKNQALREAIQVRDQLKDEIKALRKNIAMDFHDDMGNKIARISLLSELLENHGQNLPDTDKQKIHQIKEDAKNLYYETKEFVWSLKNEQTSLDELITYITDFANDFLLPLGVEFESERKGDSFDDILSMECSRDILFVCKEALTNGAVHSGCNEIKLLFFKDADALLVTYIDDGKGIEKHKQLSKRGLLHMKERIKKYQGKLEIHPLTKGTKIEFTFPIKTIIEYDKI